jgi:lysophospholipase L1-like esterase
MLYKNAELYNIRAIAPLPDGGFRLSRIPDDLRLKMNASAQNTAFYTCGCEIRFNIRQGPAKIVLRRTPGNGVPVDPAGVAEVWFGPFEGDWTICPRSIGPEPTTLTITAPANLEQLQRYAIENGLAYDPALVRVILPYDWFTELVDIEGEIDPPLPEQAPARKLLAYGSSITHGGGAVRPTESYAMLTASRLGMDLINLGFAGSAHMEAEMARFIAHEIDWDLATLEMGINVIGSWPVEQFRERVQVFVHEIAIAHPERWIFCIDLFTCVHDLQGDPLIDAYRQMVRETVEGLALPRLVYINGQSLLTGAAGLTADLVHPSSAGMQEIATRLVEVIRSRAGNCV